MREERDVKGGFHTADNFLHSHCLYYLVNSETGLGELEDEKKVNGGLE